MMNAYGSNMENKEVGVCLCWGVAGVNTCSGLRSGPRLPAPVQSYGRVRQHVQPGSSGFV